MALIPAIFVGHFCASNNNVIEQVLFAGHYVLQKSDHHLILKKIKTYR